MFFCTHRKSYRSLGLLWVGSSIAHQIVLIPGVVIGESRSYRSVSSLIWGCLLLMTVVVVSCREIRVEHSTGVLEERPLLPGSFLGGGAAPEQTQTDARPHSRQGHSQRLFTVLSVSAGQRRLNYHQTSLFFSQPFLCFLRFQKSINLSYLVS